MGAQFSKTAAKGEAAAEKPGEAAVAASPSKANGQENGHVKVNGRRPGGRGGQSRGAAAPRSSSHSHSLDSLSSPHTGGPVRVQSRSPPNRGGSRVKGQDFLR